MTIDCCKINQIIPSFVQSDWLSLNNQFAVKAKILQPINESDSEIEIRIYRYFTLGSNIVDIIKSNKDSVVAHRFAWNDQTTYDDYCHNRAFKFRLYLKTADLRLTRISSWKDFFNILIENHLYSLPSSDDLDIEVLKKYPNTVVEGIGDGSKIVIELKVKNEYRVINYHKPYDPEPTGIRDYQYAYEILKTFNDLKLKN